MENEKDEKERLKQAKKEAIERTAYPIFLWYRYFKIKKEIDKNLKNLEKENKERLRSMPMKFKYLCSTCLYQTNEFTKSCPMCESVKLQKTEKNI
jgi:lipopolysaccharide biosynthesis regulator YciM